MKETENTLNRRKSHFGGKYSLRKRKIGAKIAFAREGFGKRLSSSSDLMNPSRLWMHSIPTEDCDVLFTFPPNSENTTIMWLLSCLRTRLPQLEVKVRHHASTKSYGFYITTSFDNLLKGAEEKHIRKHLKDDYGGGLKEFIYDEQKCFKGIENSDEFLTSYERQSIVLHLIHSLRAVIGDQVENVQFVEGQAIIPKCLSQGIISQVLPLHKEELIEELRQTWVRAFFKPQPIDKICEYFGVKIAIYFAWLGHYTSALVIPAIFGLFLSIIFLGRDQAMDDVCFVLFGFLNVIWSALYLVSWKRYCAELTYRWGTFDHVDELLAEPRPLFRGDLVESPVTCRPEPYYPSWKRNFFRYFVSLPVVMFCLVVVLMVMFAMMELQDWWDKKLTQNDYSFFFLSYLPKILFALIINMMDVIYQKIAVWLNDQENYRVEETYENHLIIKIVVFQFVNSFLSLFYLAFYQQDMEKLREQLAALLITRQVVGNIRESFVPFVLEQFKLARMSFEMFGSFNSPEFEQKKNDDLPESSTSEKSESTSNNNQRNLSQAEVESSLYPYDGTFEDYLEMFIQFGYVVLFSSAFPLAALCALLNNIIEIRSDAFKLCCIFQRPFGQNVKNNGSWQDAMEMMCIIAVIVNCALIGMSGQVHRMFPDQSTNGTLILIVVLEHITLTLKWAITRAIPDTPEWVATETAKIEFKRREAVKKLIRTQSSSNLVLRSPSPIIPLPMTVLKTSTVECQTEDQPQPLSSLTNDITQQLSAKLSEKIKKAKKKARTRLCTRRPLRELSSLDSKSLEKQELFEEESESCEDQESSATGSNVDICEDDENGERKNNKHLFKRLESNWRRLSGGKGLKNLFPRKKSSRRNEKRNSGDSNCQQNDE